MLLRCMLVLFALLHADGATVDVAYPGLIVTAYLPSTDVSEFETRVIGHLGERVVMRTGIAAWNFSWTPGKEAPGPYYVCELAFFYEYERRSSLRHWDLATVQSYTVNNSMQYVETDVILQEHRANTLSDSEITSIAFTVMIVAVGLAWLAVYWLNVS